MTRQQRVDELVESLIDLGPQEEEDYGLLCLIRDKARALGAIADGSTQEEFDDDPQ